MNLRENEEENSRYDYKKAGNDVDRSVPRILESTAETKRYIAGEVLIVFGIQGNRLLRRLFV